MGAGNIVRFFFGAHGTESDARAILDHFQWCTVFAPEAAGWDTGHPIMYKMLSRGNMTAFDAFVAFGRQNGPFGLAELEFIEGSGKRIALVDTPRSPASFALKETTEEKNRLAYQICKFDEALDVALQMLRVFVAMNQERERGIIERLQELDASTSFERILVRLGMCHYRIADQAADAGLKVERVFQRIPFGLDGLAFHYCNSGVRMPRLFLARYFFSQMLERFWWRAGMPLDSDQLDRVLALMAGEFSEEEIASLWERARGDEMAGIIAIRTALCDKGFRYGIEFPQ